MRVFHVLVLINLFDFGVVLTKDYSNHIKENHKAELQVKHLANSAFSKEILKYQIYFYKIRRYV